ncbi:hypothetical protein SVIOM74S_05571 [Streptomyces violarus]
MCLASWYSRSPVGPSSRPTPEAAEAAPLRLRHVGVEVVDPDGAVPQPLGDALGAARVGGPHPAGQAVARVVGQFHRLVLGAEALDGDHRAEDLLLDDPHRPVAVGEDRRQQEEAAAQGGVVGAGAAGDEAGALLLGDGDVALDLLAVLGGAERAALGALRHAVAEPDGLGAAGEGLDEPVVQRVLDQQARTGRADLPGMQEGGVQRVVHGGVEVGVREDDVGVLAAEFERDVARALGGAGHDGPPGGQAAGEGHQVDLGVADQGRAYGRPGAQHQVGDAGRCAGLLDEPDHGDRGERCGLAGLEDEGVAGGQRRGYFFQEALEQRVVPGGDERADADRLVDDAAEDVRADVHDPAAVLAREFGVVAEGVRHVLHVDAGLGQRLAGVEGLGAGDVLLVAQQQVADAQQEVGPVVEGGVRPVLLVEGAPGGAHGAVHVGGVGLVDGGDDGRVVGVDHLPPATGRRLGPLAVDVQLAHRGAFFASGRCRSARRSATWPIGRAAATGRTAPAASRWPRGPGWASHPASPVRTRVCRG